MHDIYSFVSGPLVWVAFIIFFGGSAVKILAWNSLCKKKDPTVHNYWSWIHVFKSLRHWLTPFGTLGWKSNPGMCIATFAFHLGVVILPFFIYAHIILLEESVLGIGWPAVPDSVADTMSIIVVVAALYFLIRRIIVPEAKYVTSFSDYAVLAIAAAPFITGFWAYHHLPGYSVAGLLHILSGEIMLAAIPFTRLSHMFFFPFTRGYIGSEFGAVRHARDW